VRAATDVTGAAGNRGRPPCDSEGMRVRPGPVVALLLAPVLGAVVLAGCGGDDRSLAGVVREPLPAVGDLALPDAGADGAPFAFRAPDDGLLLVYFGFTYCPDVCPTTMADVRQALRDLDEDDAARVEVAMATVDPGRDTPEVITGYVQGFVEGGHGLRTDDPEALQEVADAFGASYSVETVDGEVEVAHTGYLYAVDDEGRLLVTWPFGTPDADLRADIELLLDEGAAATGAV
jgi:protein SCO1/2